MPDNSEVWREEHEHEREERQPAVDQFLKLPAFLKLTNTDPFVAWFVVTGDATPDGIRVVRSVMGAIRSPPIVALREIAVLRGQTEPPIPRGRVLPAGSSNRWHEEHEHEREERQPAEPHGGVRPVHRTSTCTAQ